MGTHSTIHFTETYSEDNKIHTTAYCTIYQQYDGYPSCVGKTLAIFLKNAIIKNGFSLDDLGQKDKIVANGIGCLAAQFIVQIKTGVGGVYMAPNNDKEEYNYYVNYDCSKSEIKIKVYNYNKEKTTKHSMNYGLVRQEDETLLLLFAPLE